MAFYKTIRSENGETTTLSIMFETDMTTTNIDSDHPNYDAVRALLEGGDSEASEDEIRSLISTSEGVGKRMASLTEKVTYDESGVYFEHDRIDDELARYIKRIVNGEADGNVHALVNFLEKLYAGSNEKSRKHLFRWLSDRNLTIFPDGDFLAYKGVQEVNEQYRSIQSGTAYVDNVKHVGTIPNPIGSTVSMPRSEVEDDENVYCGPGLHVGTWKYAEQWGHGYVLKAKCNPANVVSVPVDWESQKMRLNVYQVIDIVKGEITDAVDASYEHDEWDDEEDDDFSYCESCGITITLDESLCSYCEEEEEEDDIDLYDDDDEDCDEEDEDYERPVRHDLADRIKGLS